MQSVFRSSNDVPEGSRLLEDYNKEANHNVTEAIQSLNGLLVPGQDSPRQSTFIQYLKRFLFFCLPSFIQHRIRPVAKSERLHPTAYLDGMRGLAALLVFGYHLASCSFDVLSAYGANDENRQFLKMPFIRFIYAGPAMVSIFYVVSGYALSYKPVKLMRSQKWEDLMHTLASSVFRRAIRLYLPCIASTLMIVALVRMGAYDWGREFAESRHHFNHHHVARIQRTPTLHAQLQGWAQDMWTFIHPWSFGTKDTDIRIDGHLWTIPMEFRSSLVLYLTQAGVARLKPAFRIAVLVALIVWVLFKDRWEMILFYSGFLFAELGFRRAASAAGSILAASTATKENRRLWSAIYIATFLVGIYLGGQPQRGAETSPGWVMLSSWIPSFVHYKQRYWPGFGAILMVWATSNSPALQRIFTNGPVQYLGKISFSLYVMHGPVTHSIGFAAMNVLLSLIGWETAMTKGIGFGIAGIITLVVTVWAADVFMRAVDEPSVKFAKWLEGKCSVSLA